MMILVAILNPINSSIISIPTCLELDEEKLLSTENFVCLFQLHANLNRIIAKLEENLNE
ncbi:hypothetical protein [Bacillus cereus]|uniref:hypothetical protein n=1 Tax=Bacillus cereus TaxID=1396 RepID=UPI0015CF4198|nr:hypothetical protein [Bacillus cereus]